VNQNRYSGQIVIENNISVFNGGTGIQTFLNTESSPNAKVYIRQNTTYGNQTGRVNANPCAEINLNYSLSTEVYSNLIGTGAATGCQGAINIYAIGVTAPDQTDVIDRNFLYNGAGNKATVSGSGFVYGASNLSGTNPVFANPVKPSAPNCGSASNVPDCMATMIANFTPTAVAAKPYGYQIPSSTQTFDPLFPQWLCNVTLPAGLVGTRCVAQSSLPASPTGLTVVSVQ